MTVEEAAAKGVKEITTGYISSSGQQSVKKQVLSLQRHRSGSIFRSRFGLCVFIARPCVSFSYADAQWAVVRRIVSIFRAAEVLGLSSLPAAAGLMIEPGRTLTWSFNCGIIKEYFTSAKVCLLGMRKGKSYG